MYKIFAIAMLVLSVAVALFVDEYAPQPASETDATVQPVQSAAVTQPSVSASAQPENISEQDFFEADDGFGQPTDTGEPMFGTEGAADDEDFGDIEVDVRPDLSAKPQPARQPPAIVSQPSSSSSQRFEPAPKITPQAPPVKTGPPSPMRQAMEKAKAKAQNR